MVSSALHRGFTERNDAPVRDLGDGEPRIGSADIDRDDFHIYHPIAAITADAPFSASFAEARNSENISRPMPSAAGGASTGRRAFHPASSMSATSSPVSADIRIRSPS